MEITGEIRTQAEQDIKRSEKTRQELELQIEELSRPSDFKHDGQVLKMPDLNNNFWVELNNTTLVSIKKFEQDSVEKLVTYDMIDAELISQVSKNFQEAILNHLPGAKISLKLVSQLNLSGKPKVDLDNFRLSQRFEQCTDEIIEWPDEASKEMKAGNQKDLESFNLVGIEFPEYNEDDEYDGVFNFQLSNGKRAVLAKNPF